MTQKNYTKAMDFLLEKSEEHERATNRAIRAQKRAVYYSWFMLIAGLSNVATFIYSYWILSQ